MDAKTVYDKTVFTREEVARAYNAADGKIIGAHLICGVELQIELHGLGLINEVI